MCGRIWKACLVLFIALFNSTAMSIRPNVIYGDDNRTEYFTQSPAWRSRADSTVALIRASSLQNLGDFTKIISVPMGPSLGLCPTERFYNQTKAAVCSGFLVGADLVVTAGHCITSQSTCDQTRFVFGYRLEDEGDEVTTVPSEFVFSCRRLVHTVTVFTGEDFAVVKLDRPVTHTPPLTFRTLGRPGTGDAMTVIGHPAGIPVKVADGASVRRVESDFMVTNTDTFGINSGSAVFNSVSGDVEGILVRGEQDYILKDGCYISKVCDSGLCRGEDVTLFERVLPFLRTTSN